jgi:hypothetical protein
MKPATVVLLLLLSACNSFGVRASQGDARDVFRPRPGPTVPGDTVVSRRPQTVADSRGLLQRRTCRGEAVPRGWAIRSYEQDGQACQQTRDRYNVAVIEDLEHYPVNTVLAVCADQKRPDGWTEDAADTQATCAGAHVKDGKSTVMLIRKLRE